MNGVIHRHLCALQFSPDENRYVDSEIEKLREGWGQEHKASLDAQRLRQAQLDARLCRLTDAYLDNVIERDLFGRRKEVLLREQRELQEHVAALENDSQLVPNQVADYLELAGNALLTYEMGIPTEKREMLKVVTSNRLVNRKNVEVKLSSPFEIIANRPKNVNGDPQRDRPRTLSEIVAELVKYIMSEDVRERSP